MATIQIKNVPDDVHKEMHRRAEKAGKSLQSYLLDELCRSAGRMPLDEWLAQTAGRRGSKLTVEEAARSIREDRDSR